MRKGIRGNARSRAVIAFIEQLCVPEGKLVGQKIKLLPFQKKFIHEIYGRTGIVTREAYLSIARKNGKSAILAAILLCHIVGPEAITNSQVVSGARSRDQAALIWALAAMGVTCKHKNLIPV